MSKTDLNAVAARRAAVAHGLAELEAMYAKLGAEDQELEVVERVLRRLADLLNIRAPLVPSKEIGEGPVRTGDIEVHSIQGRKGSGYQTLLTRIRDASSRLFS